MHNLLRIIYKNYVDFILKSVRSIIIYLFLFDELIYYFILDYIYLFLYELYSKLYLIYN
jgi:hypothetical protein